MIQRVDTPVCVHGEEANKDKIGHQQHPGEHSRPRQYQVKDKYDSEQHAGLPGMEPHIVALVLQQQ